MKKSKVVCGGVLAVLLSLTGCISTYDSDMNIKKISNTPKKAVVAVNNFQDERQTILSDKDSVWAAGIPFMPFGWGTFYHPEKGSYFLGTSSFDFHPDVDFAKSAECALNKSGLFTSAYYADKYTGTKTADYIFTGNIYSTMYKEKLITYGVSVLSPALWALGLPNGTTQNGVKIRFILKDAKTDKIVWSYMVGKNEGSIQWIYLWDRNFQDYSNVMSDVLSEALQNLSAFMNNNSSMQ